MNSPEGKVNLSLLEGKVNLSFFTKQTSILGYNPSTEL